MPTAALGTFYLVAFWFTLVTLLGHAGLFASPPGAYPVPLLLGLLVPIAVYAADRRFLGGRLWRGILALSPETLVRLQVFRIGGVFFLIEWARGHLPAGFALPAGIGDLLVGFAAPWVAARVAARRGDWQRLLLAWNTLGLADLTLAVAAGATHAQSPFGIFASTPPSDPVVQYPLHLIPVFLVPLAVILHLTVIRNRLVSTSSDPRYSSRAPVARK